MSRPIHFEIHAADPQRAMAFYAALLGWVFDKFGGPEDYWLIKTGEPETRGIDGGMLPRRGPGPTAMQAVNAFVCTVDVANLDTSLQRAVDLGGSVALPKMPIPMVGWLAYISDTEGNILGMLQADSNAK